MSFYPAFQRVLAQYEKILENGGIFVYDTGYLYLLGSIDDSLLTDLLLLVLCICFSFSNVMALEDSRGMWKLLSATRCGRRKVLRSKYLVCSFVCIGITLFPWIFRWISISKVYPMAELLAGIQNIPQYSHFALNMPILLFLFLAALIQAGTVLLITFLVLLLSRWRKKRLSGAVSGAAAVCRPTYSERNGTSCHKMVFHMAFIQLDRSSLEKIQNVPCRD